MDRVAIFVDAGYLFAQGSAALTGSKKPRSLLSLDAPELLKCLSALATDKTGLPILRTYWYDGAISFRGPTIEQAELAHLDDVKVRLGFINSAGQQKGVDSLIVTDLIELARQHAICDAVLLAGDEDVRVGVQIAQSYGVRIHLLGIFPARGSQSRALQQEADTTAEWDKSVVEKFLTLRRQEPSLDEAFAQALAPSSGTDTASVAIEKVVAEVTSVLEDSDVEGIFAFWKTQRGVPQEFDGKLLGKCRAELGRDLDTREKGLVRAKFSVAVKAMRES